jgi:hypothetical protein
MSQNHIRADGTFDWEGYAKEADGKLEALHAQNESLRRLRQVDIVLHPVIDADGMLCVRDQENRRIRNIAAVSIVQSWNTQAPVGLGLAHGTKMISINIVCLP